MMMLFCNQLSLDCKCFGLSPDQAGSMAEEYNKCLAENSESTENHNAGGLCDSGAVSIVPGGLSA